MAFARADVSFAWRASISFQYSTLELPNLFLSTFYQTQRRIAH
jgi:hypothetical protein